MRAAVLVDVAGVWVVGRGCYVGSRATCRLLARPFFLGRSGDLETLAGYQSPSASGTCKRAVPPAVTIPRAFCVQLALDRWTSAFRSSRALLSLFVLDA